MDDESVTWAASLPEGKRLTKDEIRSGEDRKLEEGGRERSVKSFNARASNVVSPVLVMKNIITPARISHALCTSCSRIPDATPKDTRTYVRLLPHLLLLLLARGNPVTVIYVTTFFPNSPRPLRQQPGHLDKKFDNSLYRASPTSATPVLEPTRSFIRVKNFENTFMATFNS